MVSSACAAASRPFDANTGKHLWTAYSTGPDDEVLIDGDANANYPSQKGKDLGVSTWQGDEWKRGGGTTWGWYSYDPELDLFYYSVGNPGTWNPDQRPGDNKWSMTIFARNPDNGQVEWAYQMTPHDEWDYDGVNENVLFESGGKKLLGHFDRNGIAYTVDRTNGKVIVGNAYGPINWAKNGGTGTPVEGVVATGVPVKDPKYGTTSKKNTEGICPAAIGFKDQQPVGVLADHRPLLRPDQPHLHGLRGRRGEVHRRSAVRRRDRADVPGPRRPSWPVHRLGSDEGQARCGGSRRTSRPTAARSPRPAAWSSTARWKAGSRRSTRRPARSSGSSRPRRASSATR